MSNSVLLEGGVENVGSPDVNWTGFWRFSKDKKGTLQFNFKVCLDFTAKTPVISSLILLTYLIESL